MTTTLEIWFRNTALLALALTFLAPHAAAEPRRDYFDKLTRDTKASLQEALRATDPNLSPDALEAAEKLVDRATQQQTPVPEHQQVEALAPLLETTSQGQKVREIVEARLETLRNCKPSVLRRDTLLDRDLVELSLSTSPLARVTCTLTAYRGDKFVEASETKTVQWDASSNLPLTRKIRVRGGGKWSLQCGSEPFSLGSTAKYPDGSSAEKMRKDLVWTYALWKADADVALPTEPILNVVAPNPSCPNANSTTSAISVRLMPQSSLTSNETVNKTSTPMLSVHIRQLEAPTVAAGDDGSTIAKARSVISFDEAFRDVAGAIAEVAVKHAQANATELIRTRIAETLCDALTFDNLRKHAATPRLRDWLQLDRSGPLLPRTCQAVRGIRIAELAASGTAIQRAVSTDVTELAFETLLSPANFRNENVGDETDAQREQAIKAIRRAIGLVAAIATSTLNAHNAVTDAQVQALLLSLASPNGVIESRQNDWRDPLAVGTAVVTECLQQGDCSADQFQRILSEEFASGDVVWTTWSDLPRVLLGIRDVLRPAAGTPVRETIGRALNISLDVLEHAIIELTPTPDVQMARAWSAVKLAVPSAGLTQLDRAKPENEALLEALAVSSFSATESADTKALCDTRDAALAKAVAARYSENPSIAACTALKDWHNASVRDGRSETKERIALLRALANASVEQRYGTAIQLSGSLIADLIRRDCLAVDGTCSVAVTSDTAEKWFGVLGAFASYAATYDAKPSDEGASAAEIAAYRAEQRKQAMEDLIDAATDRRGRGHEHVVSLGAAVGASAGARFQETATSDKIDGSVASLALPFGVAWEFLPNGEGFWGTFGTHVQLTVLDLGQFVSSSDAELAKPNAATALYLSGQLGFLVGDAKYNALIAFDFGYAPGMDFGTDDAQKGGWRVGGLVGMYVPFIDFN